MLAITEGNKTKHQQRAGCQDTTTQCNAVARAPSLHLSASAMGTKERWEKDTTIKMMFLFLRRGPPSLSVCSITGRQGKMRAHDTVARAPSQRLSVHAMGAKKRWEKDTTIKLVFSFAKERAPFSQRMLNHREPRKDEGTFFSARGGHKDTIIKKRAARDHQVCCHFSFYIFISEPK